MATGDFDLVLEALLQRAKPIVAAREQLVPCGVMLKHNRTLAWANQPESTASDKKAIRTLEQDMIAVANHYDIVAAGICSVSKVCLSEGKRRVTAIVASVEQVDGRCKDFYLPFSVLRSGGVEFGTPTVATRKPTVFGESALQDEDRESSGDSDEPMQTLIWYVAKAFVERFTKEVDFAPFGAVFLNVDTVRILDQQEGQLTRSAGQAKVLAMLQQLIGNDAVVAVAMCVPWRSGRATDSDPVIGGAIHVERRGQPAGCLLLPRTKGSTREVLSEYQGWEEVESKIYI